MAAVRFNRYFLLSTRLGKRRPLHSKAFKGIALLALLGGSALATAQKSTLSGYLKDAETGEALIGARVYIDSLKTGAVANAYGFYSLTLPNGTHDALFSSVGKAAVKKRVRLDEDVVVDISLSPKGTLSTVVVEGQQREQETTEMSTVELSMEKVKTLPVLLGERDIIKTAQLLPGIQSGSEGSSGLYVRGGGPDQNLILLDGVPIYNANHLFGFFSVFNADAINQVKLIKGGFPAAYGGRLSSVIDIRMNEGNRKKIHGEGSVGIISAKLMLEGPIVKDRTSFMVSARRTYIDLLARPFIKMANDGLDGESIVGGYFFYDVNAKINHTINANNRLYLSAYLGDDTFYIREKYNYATDNSTYVEEENGELKWGNKLMSLRWNHTFTPKLFANTTLNYSNYRFLTGYAYAWYPKGQAKDVQESESFEYFSGIEDWSGNVDFYYYPSPRHEVRFGLGETYHTFKPGGNQFQMKGMGTDIDSSFGASLTYSHEFYAYVQDDFSLSKRLKINLGLHFANAYVRRKLYPALQPRVAVNYRLDEKSSLKAAYSRTAQFLHLLTNTSIGLPTDLWLPATDKVPPQYGNQLAFGYTRELPKGFRVGAEGYYKTMQNVIEYKEGASFFGISQGSWEDLVEVGRGYSYGAEVLFEKRTGKTTGWIGYTLSWTNRQFDKLNDGKVFPYRYDRRHDVSIVLTHAFSERVDVGLVWVYGTGNAVTLALQKYSAAGEGTTPGGGGFNDFYVYYNDSEINHIDQRNGYRMPSYHRLDLGVNLHKKKKWGTATWSFGLYNAYSRQNPFFLRIAQSEWPPNKNVLQQVSLFPIIPSVSYAFTF